MISTLFVGSISLRTTVRRICLLNPVHLTNKNCVILPSVFSLSAWNPYRCCDLVLRYQVRHSCPCSDIKCASQAKTNLFIIGRSPGSRTLLRPYGFLLCIQLCCCLLFIVREYWRNSTSYI